MTINLNAGDGMKYFNISNLCGGFHGCCSTIVGWNKSQQYVNEWMVLVYNEAKRIQSTINPINS